MSASKLLTRTEFDDSNHPYEVQLMTDRYNYVRYFSLSEPLAENISLPMANGEITADILADIVSTEGPEKLRIIRTTDSKNQTERFSVIREKQEPVLNGQYEEIADLGDLRHEDHLVEVHNIMLGDSRRISLRFAPKGELAEVVSRGGMSELRTAPQKLKQRFVRKTFDRLKGSDYSRKAKFYGKLGLGLMALTAPHGPADMALDATRDQAAVVADSVQDDMEGLEESNDLYDAELLKGAVQRVSQTIKDLDSGDYEAIRQRAEKYAGESASLLSPEALKAMLDRIDHSTTTADVEEIVSEVANEYGIIFSSQDTNEIATPVKETEIAKVKTAAKETLELITLFTPYDFKRMYEVNRIVVTDGINTGRNAGTVLDNGFYYHGVVYINAPSEFDAQVIEELFGDSEGVVAHEVTHSRGGQGSNLIDSLRLSPDGKASESQLTTSLYYPVDQLSRLIRFDSSPSMYSHGDPEEHTAEIGRILFNEGLVHPDEALEFESPVNRDVINMLTVLDAQIPGFADYFISRTSLNQELEVNDLMGGRLRTMFLLLSLGLVIRNPKPKQKRVIVSEP